MSRGQSDPAAIEAEVKQLENLDLDDLRSRWKKLFGNTPPMSLRTKFLRRAVAYQIQVEAYGGLSASVRRHLREVARAARTGDASTLLGKNQIKPGTQMIREWKGVTHVLTVLETGFEWRGQTFKSLSAIARAITGTNWNGYSFFGVERSGRSKAGVSAKSAFSKNVDIPTKRPRSKKCLP
jgi:hypothetical protein